ncbi:hypothetical protein NE865_16087 [Phthorimaea operculella]|nr:hypothetical protein NE865_16087 [Phthorimaea operculella]
MINEWAVDEKQNQTNSIETTWSNLKQKTDKINSELLKPRHWEPKQPRQNFNSTAFKVEEVAQAKKLLYDTISTNLRHITRKGNKQGKIQRDLADIIVAIKQTDPENIPIFVAKDLQKLPPVLFDHLDCTNLLKQLVLLRSEIDNIKANYITTEQLEAAKSQWHSEKYDSILNSNSNMRFVNTKQRGGYQYHLNSGPLAMTPDYGSMTEPPAKVDEYQSITTSLINTYQLDEGDGVRQEKVSSCSRGSETDRDPQVLPTHNVSVSEIARMFENRKSDETQLPTNACAGTQSQPMTHVKDDNSALKLKPTQVVRNISFADLINDTDKFYEPEKDAEWHDVQRKRLKNRFMSNKGKASMKPDMKFKAAETKEPLFITNVHKDVSEADISAYILEKTSEKVIPIKIKMKKERGYNAFKIFVSKSKIDVFLNDSLWPQDISFRRFINIKNRISSRDSPKVQGRQPNNKLING